MANFDEFYANGHDSYHDGVYWNANPHAAGTSAYRSWQQGWLAAEAKDLADEAYNEAYESDWGLDAVSQGYYDDDPSPYNGDYSEM